MTVAQLEQAVRAWLIAAGALGGIPNPDRAVIRADQDGTRPPMPYLTVRTLVSDIVVGVDDRWVDDSNPPKHFVRGQRVATVSVQAYGAGAYAWLQRAVDHLSMPSILALNQNAGIAVWPEGGPQNLSGLRDSHTEVRFARDFRVQYEVVTTDADAEEGVELQQVVTTYEWSSQDGSADRTEVQTINLP